ncbi:MAG: hypothetical protein LRY71_05835 [Bacillaceae bacterium]|nr:hypothetical protein [Bacillaceae bacterium]
MANAIYLVIIIVSFLFFVKYTTIFFKKVGWEVENYLNLRIPYSLGVCLLVAFYIHGWFFLYPTFNIIFGYLTMIWLIGFIDDTKGTKYPKGLKGHIKYLIVEKKVSTGIIKIIGTVSVSAVTTYLLNPTTVIVACRYFLLLTFTPHVMNLLDTKPLRVWKLAGVQALLFLPLYYNLKAEIASLGVLIVPIIYLESKRKAMLGDNGATLVGGAIALVVLYQLSPFVQTMLLLFYFFVILLAEKISISKLIENNFILRVFDRWGVS